MRRALPLVLLALAAGCGGGDERAATTTTAPAPTEPAVAVEPLELRSDHVDVPLDPRVLVPRERREDAPLLLLLHGQGGSPQAYVSPELVAELERLGDRAPVVLLPDGGEASYWHDREDGAWARMVLDEAIPAVAERYGASTERVALAGVSMGGFGALHLSRLRDVCSVSAHSPAVFTRRPRRGSPFADAFDDDADFARTNTLAHARDLQAGIWLDIGDRDPFTPAFRELVSRMRAPRVRIWRGGHDFSFWVRETPTWLRFHVERLERC